MPTFAITAIILKRHPELIKQLSRQGIEFAIHGYTHVDYRLVSYDRQIYHFKKAIEVFNDIQIPYTGFRAPFLRINGKTPQVLGKLGIAYDSSHIIAWDVLEKDNYTKSAYQEYLRLLDYYMPLSSGEYLSLPRFINRFVEIPVSIPDDEALIDRLGVVDKQALSRIWLKIFQKTYERGELFNIQLHPERISFCDTALAAVIHEAREQNDSVWIAPLSQIADWWYEKDKFSFNIVEESAGRYRVRTDCTDRAMVLVKNCAVDGTSPGPNGDYQQINPRNFIINSATRPVIGLSPDTSPEAIQFLKNEGYALEVTERNGQHHGIYLDDLAEFTRADEKQLSGKIEQSGVPIVRYARWPDGHKSAVSVSGDIDSITLKDFVMRVFENWWETRKQ